MDIETTSFRADFGIILSYCILDRQTGEILGRRLSPEEIKNVGREDARIVAELVEDMKKFDRIVTYYGQRFDVPFIRTRAAIHKITFVEYGEILHTDLYFVVRGKFKLTSNKLEHACETLLGRSLKTRVKPALWWRGERGDEKALDEIFDHNRRDVTDLQRLYRLCQRFMKLRRTSL